MSWKGWLGARSRSKGSSSSSGSGSSRGGSDGGSSSCEEKEKEQGEAAEGGGRASAFSLKEAEPLMRMRPVAALERRRAAFGEDALAGATLGALAHTLVAPLERAKLLLQTQEGNAVIRDGSQLRYKGLLDCIVRVAREEGVLSLWRGNGTSVIRHYPSLGLNFAFKDLYRSMLVPEREGQAGPGSLATAPANFLAGAAAGCTALPFVYPLDIAHTRLATDLGTREARQFKGISHFLSTVYRMEGIRGVYRGLPASLHGIVVHRSIYFGAFDTAKDYLSSQEQGNLAFWKKWLLAQATTSAAGLISYPLDTVRHRMMMQAGLEPHQRVFNGTLDCWRMIYRMEGLVSFYRGLGSKMVRCTGSAVILAVYDELKYLMH